MVGFAHLFDRNRRRDIRYVVDNRADDYPYPDRARRREYHPPQVPVFNSRQNHHASSHHAHHICSPSEYASQWQKRSSLRHYDSLRKMEKGGQSVSIEKVLDRRTGVVRVIKRVTGRGRPDAELDALKRIPRGCNLNVSSFMRIRVSAYRTESMWSPQTPSAGPRKFVTLADLFFPSYSTWLSTPTRIEKK